MVAAALEWLGTPYHHLGDVKGAGVDCAMFLVRVFVDTGLVAPFDPRPYPTDWHLHRGEERYLSAVLEQAREVERPDPGDIALYRFGRTLSHSALVIAWPRVIHAQARVGCILSDAVRDEPLASRRPRFFSLWRGEEQAGMGELNSESGIEPLRGSGLRQCLSHDRPTGAPDRSGGSKSPAGSLSGPLVCRSH